MAKAIKIPITDEFGYPLTVGARVAISGVLPDGVLCLQQGVVVALSSEIVIIQIPEGLTIRHPQAIVAQLQENL